MLQNEPRLTPKTLFGDLQRRFPGRFSDGQCRTFQRRVKQWRSEQGPNKEVMFEQKHWPGRVAGCDFTHMDNLNVTIQNVPFNHL